MYNIAKVCIHICVHKLIIRFIIRGLKFKDLIIKFVFSKPKHCLEKPTSILLRCTNASHLYCAVHLCLDGLVSVDGALYCIHWIDWNWFC